MKQILFREKPIIKKSFVILSMETILINIGIALVVTASLLLGKKGAFILPRFSRHFDRKPFNCKPCLTFWLQMIGMSLIALILYNWLFVLSGVISSFITFGIVWKIEQKKVIN